VPQPAWPWSVKASSGSRPRRVRHWLSQLALSLRSPPATASEVRKDDRVATDAAGLPTGDAQADGDDENEGLPLWWFFLMFLAVSVSLGAVVKFDDKEQANSVGLCLVSYSAVLASPRLLLNRGVGRAVFIGAGFFRCVTPKGWKREAAIASAQAILGTVGLIGLLVMGFGWLEDNRWAFLIGTLILTFSFLLTTAVWLVDVSSRLLNTIRPRKDDLDNLREVAASSGSVEVMWMLASIAFIAGTVLQLYTAVTT
jgi:hypothetical protein